MNKSESKYYNTALLMNEALLQLLEKKEFEFITITEICEKAGVNRSTFYLHYENTDDLLLETLEMLNKKFNSAFNNQKINVNISSKEELYFINEEYLIPYLNYVKENKKIYKLIHKKPYLFKSQSKLSNFYNELFSSILDKYSVSDEEKEYIFSYYTFGVVSVIQKWVEKDCKDDIELILDLIKRLIGHSNDN